MTYIHENVDINGLRVKSRQGVLYFYKNDVYLCADPIIFLHIEHRIQNILSHLGFKHKNLNTLNRILY